MTSSCVQESFFQEVYTSSNKKVCKPTFRTKKHATFEIVNQWKHFHMDKETSCINCKVILDHVREMEADKKVIEEKYREVNRLNKELNQKIKQHLAIQETGKAILSVLDLEQLLTVIMNLLYSVCKINRAIIMLVNEEERNLEYLYGVGFGNKIPEEVLNYKVPLERVRNILARVANTGRSEYVPGAANSNLRRENILISKGKPLSVYVVPFITKSRVIGILATDAAEGEAVPEETRDTLEIFAPQIAIAIENARLYSSLQDKIQELERSHVLLSRAEKFSFLGNLAARLAHEIKNPMTSIGAFIQMLPDKYDDEEFRNDFHQIALEETDRVNNLITELLDLVKERDSHFALADLHSLVDKMVLLVSPQSKSKKVRIIRQFDPSIEQAWMDAEKMKQVILNILSNAIEYTPPGGKVEILTRNCTGRGGEKRIQMEFKDNGQGIAEEILEKVFEPYFTTKHKSSLQNGTGLGLFIAHQNIEDHGGTIEVKSKINRGTTLIVTLPCGAPKEKME